MPTDSHAGSALVLIGHGSTQNGDSSAPTRQHADALREAGVFAQVLEAYWKQEPSIAAVLRGVWYPRVYVVPLFISEGYFTEQVIPRELGLTTPGRPGFDRIRQLGLREVRYCGPVGTHGSMTRLLVRSAMEIVRLNPAPHGSPGASEISLFIAGHGTGNSENSRRAIEAQVARLRAEGQFHDVHAIFMEEEPRIADCYRLAGTKNIVVVPFFISDGLHSHEDIPVLLGAAPEAVRQRLSRREATWPSPTFQDPHWVWYGRSIGHEPMLTEVILERVRELSGDAG